MKKAFYIGAIALILFEIANVYFIMPMYGSQEIQSIDVAYFLYTYRWVFRIAFGVMASIGFLSALNSNYAYVKYLVRDTIGLKNQFSLINLKKCI